MGKLQHRLPIGLALELDWCSHSKTLLSKVCSLKLQPPSPLSPKPFPGVCISFLFSPAGTSPYAPADRDLLVPGQAPRSDAVTYRHLALYQLSPRTITLDGSYAIMDGQDDRRPPGISDNSVLIRSILDTFLTR